MKNAWLFILVLMLLGMFGFGADPVGAVSAAGPYYATPSWDQKLQCDTTATCPRFVVLTNWNNEAVLDRETGLVWEQSPSNSDMTWSQAPYHCLNRTVGGRGGWHLPTIQELMSLIDRTQRWPALPAGHPFNVGLYFYWSANTNALNNYAWGVGLDLGNVYDIIKNNNYWVWCVRGGQGVNPQ